MSPVLTSSKHLVIKVGSALLVDPATGVVAQDWIRHLARDVCALRANGTQVSLVTSGAISLGRHYMDMASSALSLAEKQAAAAIGQVRLMQAWQTGFDTFDANIGQVLLTTDDTEDRRRHLNARNTTKALLDHGLIPIINENDTVATEEIRYGDNDRLSARVAQMISADTLVLLSDIDGLYTADPKQDADARHLEVVRGITPDIENMASGAGTAHSSGGMITKIAAARICMGGGCRMVIANGRGVGAIGKLDEKTIRKTWFLPEMDGPKTARKRWIAATIHPAGRLYIDAGAANALQHGNSLLPAGVTAVYGDFQRGDAVEIFGPNNRRLGMGLAAYDAPDAKAIKGCHSTDISKKLGFTGRDEVIHRDDLVMQS